MSISPEFTPSEKEPKPQSYKEGLERNEKVSKTAQCVFKIPTKQKIGTIVDDIPRLQPPPPHEVRPELLKEKAPAKGLWLEKTTKETIEALVQGFENGNFPYPTLLRTFLRIPCQELQNLKKTHPKLHAKMVHAILLMIRTGNEKEILAVFDNDKNLVKTLAELNLDVNLCLENTEPPLCQAVLLGISKADKLIRILSSLGADVNIKGTRNETPFYHAVRTGRTETVKLLASLGADVNTPAFDGTTSLREALLHQKCDMIQTLLSLHASFTLAELNEPEKNRTPLYDAVAFCDEEKVKLLISMGADINQPSGFYNKPPLWKALFTGTLSMIKFLINKGAQLNPEDVDFPLAKRTALYNAVASGNKERVKFLLSMGTDVNKPSREDNKPPLWRALFTGSLSMVKVLIKQGAQLKPEEVDYPLEKSSALSGILIAHSFHTPERLKWVKLLTSLGADCNLADEDGNTPLSTVDILPSSAAKPISQWLIDHGADKEWHETFRALKGLVHSWALKGRGKVYNVKTQTFQTIDLVGWPRLCTLKFMRETFRRFVEKQMKPMGSEYQTVGETTLKILDRSVDYGWNSNELCKELVCVSENVPVFLAGGISKHSIGVVVFQNKIWLCNRGWGAGKYPGIKEYEFDRNLEAQLLIFIQTALRGKQSWLGFKATLEDLQPCLKRTFHQSKQKVGNCSWTSYESGLHALLIILMENQTPQREFLLLDCRTIYNRFTHFARKKTLLAYLQVPKPDPSVLQQIEDKLRQGDEDLHFSSEEKEELLKKVVEKIHSSNSSSFSK